jgi:molybdopterin converting factor subunit 1
MRVKVLFFGQLKDIVGLVEEPLEVPADSRLATVFEHYAGRFPKLGQMAGSIVLARNQEFAPVSTPLHEGDEVAMLPPVSGGSGPYRHEVATEAGHFSALTREPIDTRGMVSRLARPEDGAVITFEGIVRNNSKGRQTRYLDYECYEGMAIKVMAKLTEEIAAMPGVGRVGMVHRLGRMEIGDASVAIVVTAPHRRPAYDASLEAINRLKKIVPIWKKEYFADGEVWVEGEWDESAPLAAGR